MVRSAAMGSVKITGVQALADSLQASDRKIKRIIAAQFLRAEDEATSYAKRNAPWTDRTGNARAGLIGTAIVGPNANFFELLMAHSVYYGVFLETRFSGKYAIIMPTVNWIGGILMQRMESVLSKLQEAE